MGVSATMISARSQKRFVVINEDLPGCGFGETDLLSRAHWDARESLRSLGSRLILLRR
jgi:hypothetical protein